MSRLPLRAPDFFLVGAPKCGTTALSEYLRAHPAIGFSSPKEPHFFATDRPFLRQMQSEEEYLRRAFAHAAPRAARRGLDALPAVGNGGAEPPQSRGALWRWCATRSS
jgi:hypothetical protein